MKTKFLHILTFLLLVVIAGCRKGVPAEEPTQQEDRIVNLSLGITTRADDVSSSDIPDVLYLWIFNENDNNSCLYFTKIDDPQFSGVDIEGNPVETVDVKFLTTNGTKLKFYVVLNDVNPSTQFDASTSLDDLKQITFVLNEYESDNKIPMSGTADLTIESTSNDYRIVVPAERAVAKLGIYCTKKNTSSILKINKIKLSKVPNIGYLIDIPVDDRVIVYNGTTDLITTEKTIIKSYAGDMPDYSENSWPMVETYFDELSTSYLLENLNGNVDDTNGFIQINGPVNDDRYCIELGYELNGLNYTKYIYVSDVRRNQYSKIYIRINDATTINTYCQINSWTEHKMDVPAFE